MKPIEIHPAKHSRPVGADAARSVSRPPIRSAAEPASAPEPGPEPSMVTRSAGLSAGAAAPVDADRVAQIRSAIRDGSYPLVPASVADAMIAASYILIEGTKE